MSNKRNAYNKKLLLDTLRFLIKQRNIALFRLHAFQSSSAIEPTEELRAKAVVRNLRHRIIREIVQHKHLLSQQERDMFFRERHRENNDEQ